VERVEENVGAASVALDQDDLAELDAVPPTVGDRY
jgi:aryl-alcohol dehydrogenase-like predicted oxidoreductase